MDHKMMLLHLYAGYKAGEEKTCGKKVRYSSEETAIKSAEAMNKKPTTRHAVEPYPCPFCGAWHLGGVWPVGKMQKLLDGYCQHFCWDMDWYYCEKQDKEIDPNECKTCEVHA